jgi:hypothetical protein
MAAGSGAGSLPRNSFSAPALMMGRWSFSGPAASLRGEARSRERQGPGFFLLSKSLPQSGSVTSEE